MNDFWNTCGVSARRIPPLRHIRTICIFSSCGYSKMRTNKYFPEISKRDIISYQNWLLRNNENSPARVRRLKSTLSSLSNYIEAILDDELPTSGQSSARSRTR